MYQKDVRSAVDELFEWQVGYLAALLDGEGHLGIAIQKRKVSKGWLQVKIRVSMIDELTVKTMYNITQLGNVHTYEPREGYAQQYNWSISDPIEAHALLRKVLPCMLTKHMHATLLLKFCRRRVQSIPQDEKDMEIYEQLKLLQSAKGRRGAKNE